MTTVDELLDGFKREGREDWIGLWAIVWTIRQAFPHLNASDVQTTSINLIDKMLRNGFIIASVIDKEYVPWIDQIPEIIIGRIQDEWKNLGRDPDIGEIAWFALPPAH